jgi:hypothetical protein
VQRHVNGPGSREDNLIVVSFWNHFFLPSGIGHGPAKAQGSCVVNGWLSQGLGDLRYHLRLTMCVNTLLRRRSRCNFRNGTYRDGARAGGPFASLAVNLRKVSELNACSGRVARQGPPPTILDGTPLRDSLGRAIEEMIKRPQQPPSGLLFHHHHRHCQHSSFITRAASPTTLGLTRCSLVSFFFT